MTAEDFYEKGTDWLYKGNKGSRKQELIDFAEAYHQSRVKAISDDEILQCVKHSANGITVYRDGITSINNFKNKLLGNETK